jgi:hypothetical protein
MNVQQHENAAMGLLLTVCWVLIVLLLSHVLSGCSPNYDGLGDLVDVGSTHDQLTYRDLELTEDARLEWCERTGGACCPERIEVSLCDGDSLEYSPDGRVAIPTDVVSAEDWYQQSLYLVGLVCGLSKSDDPDDAMCWSSAAMQVSDHDVEVARKLVGR